MRKITKILILFLSFFILINISFIDRVKATQTLVCNFDNVASGLENFTSGYFDVELHSDGSVGYATTSTDYDLSSPNSMMFKNDGAKYGKSYMNLTTNFSYIGVINFSYIDPSDNGDTNFGFYDADDNQVIRFRWVGNEFHWFDVSAGEKTIYNCDQNRHYIIITHIDTNQFNITILGADYSYQAGADYAGYYAGTYTNFEYILVTASNAGTVYFDNFYIDISSAPSSESCETYDSSYVAVGTGFNNYVEYGFTYHVAEFWSKYKFNGTLSGMEVYVPVDYSDSLSNWHLYVDGVYTGSADCCFAYGYGYKLQFNDINIIVDDTYPIFDIYRTDDNVQLLVGTHSIGLYENWDQIRIGTTSIINDNFDGTQIYARPQYMLYVIANETEITNCGYANSLDIINLFPNATGDFNSTTYKTIFFSTTVNSTATPYHKLAIYKGSTLQYVQNYPRDLIKCSGIYGFTPTSTGSYYAVLTDSGSAIANTYVYFNVTTTTKNYAIFTYPNPCEFGQEVTVNTYINDTGTFVVGLFATPTDSITYSEALLVNSVTNGTDSYTISTGILQANKYYYLRIFKDVAGTLSAVGDYYTQFVYGAETTSYLNLNKHAVEPGETVLIFGSNQEIMTRVGIFSNTILIYDNLPNGNFNYNRTYDTEGTYQITLKKYVNNNWELIDAEQLTVQANEDEMTWLPNIGGTTLGWIIGFVIVLLFTLVPLGIAGATHVDVPIVVYGLFSGIGLTFSIAIGYIAWWVAFIIIALLVCIIIIEYLRGSGVGSGS